jgi:hypothetical protein
LSRDTRRTQGALEFQGVDDGALIAPVTEDIALDQFQAVGVAAHKNLGINGLNGISLDRIGRLTDEDLGLAKSGRDKARIGAVELDLHGPSCSELDVTAGRHTDREASDGEIGAVECDWGGGWGHDRDIVERGRDILTVIHEAQAVRRGTRDTRLARRTRRTRS